MTINKSNLHGVKVYKSFNDFVKDLSQSLEKEHDKVHNEHKKQIRDAANKTKGP